MVFAPGVLAGYFSGGCVEADIARHASACLASGEPGRLVYGEGSPWPDIRLLCGGRMEIVLERVHANDPALADLLAAYQERRPVIWLSDGHARRCAAQPEPWPGVIVERHFHPPQRLVVVGADPTALAIAQLGTQVAFQTTLVCPKGPHTPPPISGVVYRRDTPQVAFAAIGMDAWTAIAIATHDVETDREALLAALPSNAGYVGLLGARRRLPERLSQLRAEGMAERTLSRLHAPIGLDIAAKAPWAIAVSVIGEIMALRHASVDQRVSTTLRRPTAPLFNDLRDWA